MIRHRPLVLAAVAIAAALAAAACGNGSLEASGALDSSKLTIYSAQHKELTQQWAKAFQDKTGTKVQIRFGSDSAMAAQLSKEGARTPADVFLTENSAAVTAVENAGLLAPVDPSTTTQVSPAFVPSSGKWVGVAARSTVLVYNPAKISVADLPASIMDLAQPRYAGQWGAAAGGADFQAIVSGILASRGEQATSQWLRGLKSGAKIYQNNIATMKAVNAGQVPMGVIYHYYWYRDQALQKASSANTKLYYFKNQDAGAFVSVSAGAVLKASKRAADAQQFLAFVTSPPGQRMISTAKTMQYAVGAGVASDPALPPLASLQAPAIDPFTLDLPKVISLMTSAGIL